MDLAMDGCIEEENILLQDHSHGTGVEEENHSR